MIRSFKKASKIFEDSQGTFYKKSLERGTGA
jgi:hypothetical protein